MTRVLVDTVSMKWTRQGLESRGFRGFVPFSGLTGAEIPKVAGVYVVVRPAVSPPVFVSTSAAGHFKGRDPSVRVEVLQEAWVEGAEVLYFGKAGSGRDGRRGLRKRLDEYRRFGMGEAVAHWGGRFIWQMDDAGALLVGWWPTPQEDPSDVEARMIAEFVDAYGARPFANRNRGRRFRS